MKKFVAATLTSLLSIALAVFVLEIFAVEIIAAFFNKPIHYTQQPEGLRILSQSSKNNIKPVNYIAIAGDSNAFGYGDWFHQMRNENGGFFSSSHLIHQKTGLDVVNFGSAGASNIRGFVTEPISNIAYIKKMAFYSIDDPDYLLLYFYEGNDINDNIEYLQGANKKIKPFEQEKVFDRNYMLAYLEEVAINSDDLYRKSQDFPFTENFYITRFGLLALKIIAYNLPDIIKNGLPEKQNRAITYNSPGRWHWIEPGDTNKVIINDEIVQLPDYIQGPAMDLDQQQLEKSLYLLDVSLQLIQKKLPNTKIGVVYIPSVISSYRISSETLKLQTPTKVQSRKNGIVFQRQDIIERSLFLQDKVKEIATKNHMAFSNATPLLQETSAKEKVNGPMDWNHFNRAGQHQISAAALKLLEKLQR